MNNNVWNIIACKRSGHTAIMFWLLSQGKDFIGPSLDYKGHEGRYYHSQRNDDTLIICPFSSYFSLPQKELSAINEYKKKGRVVLDNQLSMFNRIDRDLVPHNFPIKDTNNIIILRSWFSWCASVCGLGNLYETERNDLVLSWKNQAKEILGDTNLVPDKKVILYDKWVKSERYRRKLAKVFRLEFTDIGYNRVAHHGSGSSFDLQKYDGKAYEMKVLERHKLKMGDGRYQVMANDLEAIELNKRIFGRCPYEYRIHNNEWHYLLQVCAKYLFGKEI